MEKCFRATPERPQSLPTYIIYFSYLREFHRDETSTWRSGRASRLFSRGIGPPLGMIGKLGEVGSIRDRPRSTVPAALPDHSPAPGSPWTRTLPARADRGDAEDSQDDKKNLSHLKIAILRR